MQTTSETTPNPPAPMFAIFDGDREITEEMYKEVLDFTDYVKAKDAEK